MKDISQCLLSLIEEFDKYQSVIGDLEDEKNSYDDRMNALEKSKENLLTQKEKALTSLQEKHDKLQSRESYNQTVITELRDENAHLDSKNKRLQESNIEQEQEIKALKAQVKILQLQKPEPDENVIARMENIKTELILAQQELGRLKKVQQENIQLRQRHQEMVERRLNESSREAHLQEEINKLHNEKRNSVEKIKHLEFEHQGLKTLYNKALNELELLKKKAEDLIVEKYNTMYKSKEIFGVDVDVVRGQNSYVDIDSLIEDIDAEPMKMIKAPA